MPQSMIFYVYGVAPVRPVGKHWIPSDEDPPLGVEFRDRGNRDRRNEPTEIEFRCRNRKCGKLIGIIKYERVHLKYSHCPEHHAGFPLTSVCCGCGTHNELPRPPKKELISALFHRQV